MTEQKNYKNKEQPSLFIGLMSGTSMDNIDAVLVDLSHSQSSPTLLSHHSHDIDPKVKQQLLSLCDNTSPITNKASLDSMAQMDITLGNLFAEAVKQLLTKEKISSDKITAIGSHGQTINHIPPTKNQQGSSLQIGDPNIISYQTGITTIADFRRKDMAAQGQGAPLVPAFHRAVFSSEKINRVIVNIGGISNITVLPATAEDQTMSTGFDTGPGNVLLDLWIHQQLGKNYDNEGKWAKSGGVHRVLLRHFLSDNFFALAPPKSTGRELFNKQWLQQKLDARDIDITDEDIQSTLTELTAQSLAEAIYAHANNSTEVYLCGGGANNKFLYERIQFHLSRLFNFEMPLFNTGRLGIDPQWVEAIAFAWLAKQTLNKLTGNIPTVTGAEKEVVLGGIYQS